jgi:hypothetical protein
VTLLRYQRGGGQRSDLRSQPTHDHQPITEPRRQAESDGPALHTAISAEASLALNEVLADPALTPEEMADRIDALTHGAMDEETRSLLVEVLSRSTSGREAV